MKVETLNLTAIADLLAAPPEAPAGRDGAFHAAFEEAQRDSQPAPETGDKPHESEPTQRASREGAPVREEGEKPALEKGATTALAEPQLAPGELAAQQLHAELEVIDTGPATLPEIPLEGVSKTTSPTAGLVEEGDELTAPTATITGDGRAESSQATELPVAERPVVAGIPGPRGKSDVAQTTPGAEAAKSGEQASSVLPASQPLGGTPYGGDEARPGTQQRDHTFFLLDADAETASPKAMADPAVEAVENLSPRNSLATASTPARVAAGPSAPISGSGSEGTAPTEGISDAPSQRPAPTQPTRSEVVLRADPTEASGLARRVSRLVRRAVRSGEGRLRIQLDPPMLGRIDVDVRLGRGTLNVHIQVDDESVRDVLVKHLDELQKALEESGYRSEGVTVDLRQQGQLTEHGKGEDGQGPAKADPDTAPESEAVEWLDATRGGVVDLRA